MKILEPNINSIFKINSHKEFVETALSIFRYQACHNVVYKEFVSLLGVDINNVNTLEQIPFLPISFFKTKKVVTNEAYQKIFKSSGTTGQVRSQHFIHSLQVYIDSFTKGMDYFYPDYKEYSILALLPSYLEQGDSSLIYMVSHLIDETKDNKSSFYLNNKQELYDHILKLEENKEKFILFGVSYALLDFKDEFPMTLKSGIIMETGGMKGRRKEVTKQELHQELMEGFGTKEIHSEYGMTELLSQAYSKSDGVYKCPPWMKVLIRNTTDPFQISTSESKGLINVIDLANIYSCSFIATDDIGKIRGENEFSVLGRFDTSEIRGCNLMVD